MADNTGERMVWNSCNVNCGSRCPLRVFVRDGRIVRVEPDNTGDDSYGTHQVRACVRGLAIRERVQHPDRLMHPLRRTGPRGSGKFERISWEEAYRMIAESLRSVIARYGNEAVYINYATGALGGTLTRSQPPAKTAIARLMNLVGGYLDHYGTYSTAQIDTALPFTYGEGSIESNSINDIANSELVIFWGNNPAETRMSGGGALYDLIHTKETTGVRIICIDPLYTDSAMLFADEWIPIRPGTDAALASALAHVLISEDFIDREFLARHTIGYDEESLPKGIPTWRSYESYILGRGPDGIAKTPEWAAPITGIPAERIRTLAREIAAAKPCAVIQGWGPQRHHNGEQSARAICMIPILTGNVGIHGGGSGGREETHTVTREHLPVGENPVKATISVFSWSDAILHGETMTATNGGVRGADRLSAPIKFLWNYAGNVLGNQHSDINRTMEILADESLCEMIVVIDTFMTNSARFADLVLPGTTNLEHDDIASASRSDGMQYLIYAQKAIEPPGECQNIYQICRGVARCLGVEEAFTEGRDEDGWLRTIYETRLMPKEPWLPDFETMKEIGLYKVPNTEEPYVAYKAFREDPAANPLETPSGRIEIFSTRLWEIGQTWELPEGDRITALPEYVETREMPGDPLSELYPLQMITTHFKGRTHSSYANLKWLNDAQPQVAWINPIDAAARGIEDGSAVRVWNDRGRILLKAKVTPRIIPGAISVPEGAWFRHEFDGVDRGGNPNTLTSLWPSPLAKGNAQHTNLVQVEAVVRGGQS